MTRLLSMKDISSLLVGVALIVGLYNCNNPIREGFAERTVQLENGIRPLTIDLPGSLDTFYTWDRTSDYWCGHEKMYRWADSHYSLIVESGFFSTESVDSLFQFTITHPANNECHTCASNADTDSTMLQGLIKKHLSHDLETKVYRSEVKRIKGMVFTIVSASRKRGGLDQAILEAHACISGQPIKLEFECMKPDCSGFLDQMYQSLLSVRTQ